MLLFNQVLLYAKLLQSCETLFDSMDYSLSGSSVHGILQARILELPCPPPGDLPTPEIEPDSLMSPTLVGRIFTTSATWEASIGSHFFFPNIFFLSGLYWVTLLRYELIRDYDSETISWLNLPLHMIHLVIIHIVWFHLWDYKSLGIDKYIYIFVFKYKSPHLWGCIAKAQ